MHRLQLVLGDVHASACFSCNKLDSRLQLAAACFNYAIDFSWLQPCNYIDQLDIVRPDLKATSAIVVQRTSARAEMRRLVPMCYAVGQVANFTL